MNARTRKNKIPDIIPESSGETNQDITGIEHIVKCQVWKLRKQDPKMFRRSISGTQLAPLLHTMHPLHIHTVIAAHDKNKTQAI